MPEPNQPDEIDEEVSTPGSGRTKRRLSFGMAMALYAVIAAVSWLTLSGNFRILMLVVLGGLAALTYTHRLREKLDEEELDKLDK